MTLGNDNGTDGRTDRRTDRVRRNMRPPPREEGRIIMFATVALETVPFTRRKIFKLSASSKSELFNLASLTVPCERIFIILKKIQCVQGDDVELCQVLRKFVQAT